MIRLGGHGIQTKTDDPWEIARAHKAFGYQAAYCPEFDIQDSDRISATRKAFACEDVIIAEVGAWCNLIDPNDRIRNKNFRFVTERLALADEVGALSCVDFIGSFATNTKRAPHPDNLTQVGFEKCVETVRKVIDEVKPRRAKFCLEFMQWVLPDSPEACLDLIKAVDRSAFGVHLDPANLVVSPRQYFNNTLLIKRCFELLHPWIVSGHAKDITLRDQLALHLEEVVPGQGNLDYATYLDGLNKLPGDVPLMIEHLDCSEKYIQARDYLLSIGCKMGIAFRGNNIPMKHRCERCE